MYIRNNWSLTPIIFEQFAQTINKLKGKVTILFITHQKPKGLKTDEAVILGRKTETREPHNRKLDME